MLPIAAGIRFGEKESFTTLRFAFSLIGAFYVDSGIITVALGMYLAGALIATLWCWLQQYRSWVTAKMIYSMGLPFVVILMRGAVPDTLARMLFMFVPLVLLMLTARSHALLSGSKNLPKPPRGGARRVQAVKARGPIAL